MNKCEVCGDRATHLEPIYGYYICEDHKKLKPIQVHEASLAMRGIGGLSKEKFFITWGIRL